MVCVHRLQDPIEANLIRGLLMNEDIPAELTGESLVGAYSGIPKLCDVRVLVPEKHRGSAEAVIQRYERARSTAGHEWHCDQCGEVNDASFEICWSCERARS